MTLTIELDSLTQEKLEAKAKQEGLSSSDTALRVLRENLPPTAPTGAISDARWAQFLDGMRSLNVKIPPHLKDCTFNREMIYNDHD